MDANIQSFDAALLEALTITASPPAIVRPYFDPIDDAANWERTFEKSQNEIEGKIEGWEESGRRLLANLAQAAGAIGKLDERQLAFLSSAAVAIEERSARYADEMVRAFKQMRKLIRRMASMSVEHHRVVAAASARMESSWEREIQVRLEAALFFRALRAEYDPAARGGEEFATSSDLKKHLEAVAA